MPRDFYKINTQREVVLQGRSTFFVNIQKNWDTGKPVDLSWQPNETLWIATYLQPETWVNHADIIPYDTGPVANSYYCTFSENPGLSFSNIKYGDSDLFVKQRESFNSLSSLYTCDLVGEEVKVVSVNKDSTASYVEFDHPLQFITGSISIGEWDIDNNWIVNTLNVKDVAGPGGTWPTSPSFMEIPLTSFVNPFDSYDPSTEIYPLKSGREFVPLKTLKWFKIENADHAQSIDIRIDYDGNNDSHVKMNVLLLRETTNTNNSPYFIPFSFYSNAWNVNWNSLANGMNELGIKGHTSAINNFEFIDYQEIHFFGYTELKTTSRNTYANELQTIDKIYDDRTSYGLLRTNPKLSANIKITVDSNEDIWLNSIDANPQLANSKYKKFPISNSSNLQSDLYKFLDNGKTPPDILFQLYQRDSEYLNTKRSFSEQFDNFYIYGVEQLNSRFYDENFSFFAPLWLRKEMPDYFVIFRVDGPISLQSYENPKDIDALFKEHFKTARIVKTYDLREQSKIGNYLRKIIKDNRFKEKPLEVSYEQDTPTVWNGVAYDQGIITSRGEFLYDFWTDDSPIQNQEEYLTQGFERNRIISTNLMNLEYLFDDNESQLYSINRYFGVYVKENQLAEFEIDPTSLSKVSNQIPLPKKGVDGEPYSSKPFVQTNEDGIQIPIHYYHNNSSSINETNTPIFSGFVDGKLPLPEMVNDPLRIFYVKDRNDDFKRIKNLKEIDYGLPGGPNYRRVTQIGLFDEKEDISLYSGVNEIVSQQVATLLNSGYSQLKLSLYDEYNDGFIFADEEEIILSLKNRNNDVRLDNYCIYLNDIAFGVDYTFHYSRGTYYTSTLLSYIQPNVNEVVTVNVTSAFSIIEDSTIFILGAGLYKVEDVNYSLDTIDLRLLPHTLNAPPTTVFSALLPIVSELTGTVTSSYPVVGPMAFNLDSQLKMVVEPIILPSVGDFWITTVNGIELIQTASSLAKTNFEFQPLFKEYKWKMVANSVGLKNGDWWDFPLYDPNGYENLSHFNNNGTPNEVAKALAGCINSFDNKIVDAVAVDNNIFLKSRIPNEEGNSISLERKMIKGISSVPNLGFYELGNVINEKTVTTLSSEINKFNFPTSTISILKDVKSVVINNDIDDRYFEDSYYFAIRRTRISTNNILNTYTFRSGVDTTTVLSASTSGMLLWGPFGTAGIPQYDGHFFKIPTLNFKIDVNSVIEPGENVGDYVEEQLVFIIKSGSEFVSQNFIGGIQRNRARALLSETDGQRYYQNKKTTLIATAALNSDILYVKNVDGVYIGAKVTGFGIPNETIVMEVFEDSLSFRINNPTLSDITSQEIEVGGLTSLNDVALNQVWYQIQKNNYSRLKKWDIQGKSLYSLPNLESSIIDNDTGNLLGFENNEKLIIQLDDIKSEFYSGRDDKIVAYSVYRPKMGIFSMLPIKNFDTDTYFSEYSYTPTLEALRYYTEYNINAPVSLIGSETEYTELPLYENYTLTLPENLETNIVWEAYDHVTKKWSVVDKMNVVTSNVKYPLLVNTFYPLYTYDSNELPHDVDPNNDNINADPSWRGNRGPQYRLVGSRNFDKRYLWNKNDDKFQLQKIRIKFEIINILSDSTITIKNASHSKDFDNKLFRGFSGLQDFITETNLNSIQKLKDDGKYLESLTSQLLMSEYDRLRENFTQTYAVKSKVVPYINKWVQEGTDARDNYYRLNSSMAFGYTNLSPDNEIDFPETTMLTQEFPYLESVPKDYPIESLEGSRSYFFAKLSDESAFQKTWYELLTGDLRDDWFSKYFAIGYPTEKDALGNLISKSRDERYTFFKYNNGIDVSQTLFRGAKINIKEFSPVIFNATFEKPTSSTSFGFTLKLLSSDEVLKIGYEIVSPFIVPGNTIREINNDTVTLTKEIDYSLFTSTLNTQIIQTPVSEIGSAKYDNYRFSAIARFEPHSIFESEAPVKYEVYKNEKFKTILLIITIHYQDYRLQSGNTEYMMLYFAKDQLRNSNNLQYPIQANGNIVPSSTLTNQFPYASINGTSYPTLDYVFYSKIRPRNGFYGGGYLELDDVKLGGIVDYFYNSSLDYSPKYNSYTIQNLWKPIVPGYNFILQEEISPILNLYRFDTSNYPYIYDLSVDSIVAHPLDKDGGLYKFSSEGDYSNGKSLYSLEIINQNYYPSFNSLINTSESILPNFTIIPTTKKQIYYKNQGLNSWINNSYQDYSIPNFNFPGSYPNVKETYAIAGGTSFWEERKKQLNFSSIYNAFNTKNPFIDFYNVTENGAVKVFDYTIEFTSFDSIVKKTKYYYEDDTDKPLEYKDVSHIGFNFVKSNEVEQVFRYRGQYEPKTIDIINYWVREDENFSKHFGIDYLLRNTHINSTSSVAGLLRNSWLNKVSDSEILKIARTSSYKSLYPLIGEVSIDKKDSFALQGSWDSSFYKKYSNLTSALNFDGITEMKELKSYLGSKVMNTPKGYDIHTFNDSEAFVEIIQPAKSVGVEQISAQSTQDKQDSDKPKLVISLNIYDRILRQILEDLNNPIYMDEFSKLIELGVENLSTLTVGDIQKMKEDYITKNIIPLFEVTEIVLYALNKEGLPIMNINLTESEKSSLGYRVDKDCKVKTISDFKYKLTKILDTKKAIGYSISATIKRI